MHTNSVIRTIVIGACFFYLPGHMNGQPAEGKSETSIELVFTESNNREKILQATVKTKIENTYQGVKNVAVNFYRSGTTTPEQLLGTVPTNSKGVAAFVIPEGKLNPVSNEYVFAAAIEQDNLFEDNREEVTIAESDFSMTLSEEDSVRTIAVSIQAPDANGQLVPVPETEVRLYVQRLFGLLPLSADPETTDENGEVSAEFAVNIPGDTAGNLVIVARVEDHERFGNLDFRRKINWGTPLVIDTRQQLRELWSSRSNAPYYLIFIVNSMLVVIWGVIAYIVYEVFQIRRIGRRSAQATQ